MAAAASTSFPFKGSDGNAYTGQTIPTAASGGVQTDTVVQATATSRSGAIAAGGTAQTLMVANPSRRGFVIQNQSSGPLYFNGLTTATADSNSQVVQPGDLYESNPHHCGTGAISIIGATTGQAFYAREF